MKSRISILGALTLGQHRNRFAIAAVLAVGLLALASPAEAEIVYKRANITIADGSYNLDLNNDGVTDFTITATIYVFDFCVDSGGVSETPASGNGALIGPLSEGDEIGPSQAFSQGAVGLEGFFRVNKRPCGTYRYYGPWDVHLKGKRYLGLSFQLNGETYYGWVQLTIVAGGRGG
jgi:hypothetical protein